MARRPLGVSTLRHSSNLGRKNSSSVLSMEFEKMIHESSPWKDRLRQDADLIDKWASKTMVSERRSFLIEQKVFLAAYAIRKLAESGKLSSSFRDRTVKCSEYSTIPGKKTDNWALLNFDKIYDFEKGNSTNISVKFLIDTIIHSILFVENISDDLSITDFFVTSDKNSAKLWLVDIGAFTKLMRIVSEDYPSSVRRVFDSNLSDWLIWRGNGDPPPQIKAKFDAALSVTARKSMGVNAKSKN
jgi:hypothetical protein